MSTVQGRVDLSPFWFQEEAGISEPSPFQTSLNDLVEHGAKKSRLLYRKYGRFGMGQEAPDMIYPVVHHDGRNVCASAYGSPYPRWDSNTGSFWHDRNFVPWRNLDSTADIQRITMPDWGEVHMVQEMLAKHAEMLRQATYTVPRSPSLPWNKYGWTSPGGTTYQFTHFMSFLDLGCFMCGETEFFTILAGDEKTADALMDKCFELSTSYSEYLLKAYGQFDVTALSSFGGDNSCMLSAEMYKKYAMRFDMKLVARYGDLPANLHSCGPSAHLYEAWSEYPNRKDIVLMQTRGIPGELHRLRKALPHTFLEITLHQPQFDFENETPDNIERIVDHYVAQADGRDISLVVVINRAGLRVDRNIEAFFKALRRFS